MRAALPLLGLLGAAACAGDVRAAEIACQRRLVEAAGIGNDLAAAQRRVAGLPREGCNEGQLYAARRLANLAGRIEAARLELMARLEHDPARARDRAFLALQAELEEFDDRRRVMREELERMSAAGL